MWSLRLCPWAGLAGRVHGVQTWSWVGTLLFNPGADIRASQCESTEIWAGPSVRGKDPEQTQLRKQRRAHTHKAWHWTGKTVPTASWAVNTGVAVGGWGRESLHSQVRKTRSKGIDRAAWGWLAFQKDKTMF